MCDTFRPLYPTKAALELDDQEYPESWKDEYFPKIAGAHLPNGEAKPQSQPLTEAVDTSG